MKTLEFKEKIMHGTKIFPFAYYSVSTKHPRYYMNIHWHSECELIRIVKGTFQLKIETRTYDLKVGDIAFINTGYIHSGIPKDCVYECIVFDISFLKKERNSSNRLVNSLINLEKEIKVLYTQNHTQAYVIISEIFEIIKEKKRGYDLKIFGLFYFFLGVIEEDNLITDVLSLDFSHKKKLLQLKKVITLIQERFMYDLSLDDLSSCINMNTNYFCKFFKELTDKTPMDYLNEYRIECAKEKLKEPSISITEVAYDCGFNDLSYFTKVFKKYNNSLTPRQFLKLKN